MADTPEAKVKKEIKKILERIPRCYYHMPVQSGYGKRTLDFICCINGQYVAIEAKAPGEKPTGPQQGVIAEIGDANGRVFVIDGTDSQYSDLETLLCSV